MPAHGEASAQFLKGGFKQTRDGSSIQAVQGELARRHRRHLAAAHWCQLEHAWHLPPAVQLQPGSCSGVQQRVADGGRAQDGIHAIRLRVLPVLAQRSVEGEVGESRWHRFKAWGGARAGGWLRSGNTHTATPINMTTATSSTRTAQRTGLSGRHTLQG